MEAFLGILLIGGFIVAYVKYQSWLKEGIRPRRLRTSLSPQQVKVIFDQTVAGRGWKAAAQGNVLVARQGIIGGGLIRQEISAKVEPTDEVTHVTIAATKVTKKVLGGYNQAHTVRMRMNRFVTAVGTQDRGAKVSG